MPKYFFKCAAISAIKSNIYTAGLSILVDCLFFNKPLLDAFQAAAIGAIGGILGGIIGLTVGVWLAPVGMASIATYGAIAGSIFGSVLFNGLFG